MPIRVCYLNLVALVHSNWNLLLAELARWNQLSREANPLAYSTASH